MRRAILASAFLLLGTLPACGQDAPSKSQAAAILLKTLQGQCDVDNERFNRNDGYPFDQFKNFFANAILAHPERYVRQSPQDGNAEFGGTFSELGDPMPLRFSIQAIWPGPYETGTVSYCPWYVSKVQIDDITVTGPKEARVTFEALSTPTKLASDMLSAQVVSSLPSPNGGRRDVMFRRLNSLGWQLEQN